MKEALLHSPRDDDPFGPEPSPVYPPSRPALNPGPSPGSSSSGTRPRSRSKPESNFIHPNESNLARADAAAAQLGLAGDTERVQAGVYAAAGADAWEHGRGRDVARELLLGGAGSSSSAGR